MKLIDSILANHPALQMIRRDIHAHPEVANEEWRTHGIVEQKLTEWGISIIQGFNGTGLIGVIRGNRTAAGNQRAIGLRADMDALPMQEANEFAHTSTHPGKMHACGHDGHTTILLAVAQYLAANKDFDGTVYLIFQPAEEGGRGAERLIAEGLFEKCPMDAVFALHNWPGMKTGQFTVFPGPTMASSSEFYVTVNGTGTHAAQPHKGVDPVMIAIQIAQSWQAIVTRIVDPLDPVVLSITQIHAGSADNVVPDTARLVGTVRAFSYQARDQIEDKMQALAVRIAGAFDATITFEFNKSFPTVINDPKQTAFATEVLQRMVGPENVLTTPDPSMSGEDFAFMLQQKPGAYVFLGNGSGDHRDTLHGVGPCNLHNASYDFNDELIPIGASYFINLVQAFFNRKI